MPLDTIDTAAIGALKAYELKIIVDPIREGGKIVGFSLQVRDVVPGGQRFISEAIKILAPAAKLKEEGSTVIARFVGVNGPEETPIEKMLTMDGDLSDAPGVNPVGAMTITLADNGVNFPGSEAFRTRNIIPG